MTTEVAVIGDNFMLSSLFEQALNKACGSRVRTRCLDLPWPDQPLQHGWSDSTDDELPDLKEYQGEPQKIVKHIGSAPILVTHLAPLSAAMLDQMPALKLVAVSRGGPVNIDLNAAHQRGVQVVNAPGRNASAVAEFTIGAIIAETRNICRGHEALRRGQWRGDLYRADVVGDELSQLSVGVIGYGEIGTRLVKLLRAFGGPILVNDPYVKLSDDDAAAGVRQVGFDELLESSDIVTLHARVTDETRGFIDAAALARMRPNAVFINTARGPLVDYDALYQALRDGQLRAAMLETFAAEPAPADLPLLALPNVSLTPHIAGASLNTVKIAADKIAEEVRRYLAGEPPRNPCR